MTTFALTLAVGAVAGIALGGSVVASVGLWIALVATFALGQAVGRDEGAEIMATTMQAKAGER